MTGAGPASAALVACARIVGSLALAIVAVGCVIGSIFTIIVYSTGNEGRQP